MPDETIFCKCGHERDMHDYGRGKCHLCDCKKFDMKLNCFDQSEERIEKDV